MLSDQSDQQLRIVRKDNSLHWYAVRAFYNHCSMLMEKARELGFDTYYAMRTFEQVEGGLTYAEQPLISNLFFVRCTQSQILDFRRENSQHLMVYANRSSKIPAPIRDKEMDMFILITSASNNQSDLECLEPKPQYAKGDYVRVTDGIYKGAQGIVKRINKDRKLLVAISGVAVIAISNIPMCYLEKIEQTA